MDKNFLDTAAVDVLKESEKRYEMLCNAMLEGFAYCRMLYDPGGHPSDWIFLSVNPAFELITGLKNCTGKKVTDIIPDIQEAFPELFDACGRVAQTGRPEQCDISFTPASKLLHISVYSPAKDHFVALFEDLTNRKEVCEPDISARKQVEKELERSYNILKGVIESPKNVLIFALDRQYRYTAFNENHRHTMKQIWGVDIAAGNSMLEYISNPDDRKKAKINFDRALSGESFTLIEAYGDTLLERRWYEDIYNPVIDENGAVIGLTLFLTDITNRKQVEEALKMSENRYRTLFEESPISLWEEDFSDLKTWIDGKKQEGMFDPAAYFKEHPEEVSRCARMVKVIHINRATMTLFGATSFHEFRKGLLTIFSKDSLDAFREELIALSCGKTEFEKETPFRTLQGEPKIVIMKVTVVPGYEQTFSRIFVSGIDITERKNVEGALHQANKKLNMLSSITRHDILNLIMAIRGYLELSEDLVDNPELKEYMKRENEAVDAIQRQIEFTRYYQDIGVEEPKWQDAGKIIGKVSQQLNLSGITVKNHLSGLEIFADPLIEKVFYNLVENSLRHGEHVTTISFSYSETASGLIISYCDDGVGISQDYRKQLFQKGFGKHTGLGLFLSREILSITGITIGENGEQGKGVNFEILVPKGGYRIHR